MGLNKEIWEGWTVEDFVKYLQPVLDMVQRGESLRPLLTTRDEVKKYCMDNQPYYKKYIPEVVKYFIQRYDIK